SLAKVDVRIHRSRAFGGFTKTTQRDNSKSQKRVHDISERFKRETKTHAPGITVGLAGNINLKAFYNS
ncbi:16618_t:CDS:1, partial [Funneliformis mosseae]